MEEIEVDVCTILEKNIFGKISLLRIFLGDRLHLAIKPRKITYVRAYADQKLVAYRIDVGVDGQTINLAYTDHLMWKTVTNIINKHL